MQKPHTALGHFTAPVLDALRAGDLKGRHTFPYVCDVKCLHVWVARGQSL